MSSSYNSFELNIKNLTNDTLTVQGHYASNGEWIARLEPRTGTQYPAQTRVGPFGTESTTPNIGSGGSIFFSGGAGRSLTITWNMPWSGKIFFSADSHNEYHVVMSQIQPHPDNSHVIWSFAIEPMPAVNSVI